MSRSSHRSIQACRDRVRGRLVEDVGLGRVVQRDVGDAVALFVIDRHSRSPWLALIRSERELIALVRRLKAERLIECVRPGAALVRGQLYETASARAGFRDCPLDHRPADAAAALGSGDADPFDLPAPHAAAGQPRNEAELQDADDPSVAFGDGEQLVRIAARLRRRRPHNAQSGSAALLSRRRPIGSSASSPTITPKSSARARRNVSGAPTGRRI